MTQGVLLVLVLRSGNNSNHTILFEVPLDPARALAVSFVPRTSSFGVAPRPYAFQATRDDTEFTVELFENNNNVVDDIGLFHNVLVGYVTDSQMSASILNSYYSPPHLLLLLHVGWQVQVRVRVPTRTSAGDSCL